MVDPLNRVSERVSEILRRAVDSNVQFYEDLTELTASYLRKVGGILTEEPSTVPPGRDTERPAAAPPPLFLEAEAGQVARAQLLISNGLEREVSAQIEATRLTGPDGQPAELRVTTKPDTLSLQPREQAVVEVATEIDDRLAPGIAFTGTVRVPDLSDAPVPLVVRRLHSVEEPAGESAAEESGDAPKPKARKKSRSKSAKTRSKKKDKPRNDEKGA